jgi:CxxC motif-containing protein (DUF1111 family)
MKARVVALLVAIAVTLPTFAQRGRPSAPPPTPQPPQQQQPPPPPAQNATFGLALRGLSAADNDKFADGRAEFLKVENVNDGLGPVFNGRSCGECHNAPAPGGGSNRLVTRFGTTTNGVFDPLTQFGGSLIQNRAIGPQDGSPHAFRPERVPQAATIVTPRRSTPLFGLGLVDATPDSVFIALAARQAAATAGKVSMVDNISAGMKTVGKFGWKGQNPTLFQFSGDAYLNELGITNPQFPNENCPSGNCAELAFNPAPGLNDTEDTEALADFMTLLAPPPRGNITNDVNDGERVFERIGCNSCHVATLQSGASATASLNRVTYHPYSDFLLHDMGSLGDGIVQGSASGREMRTAPLWGLRVVNTYLHDGRATTLEAAITAHDGQGRASRDGFQQLNANDRQKLIAFLRSL